MSDSARTQSRLAWLLPPVLALAAVAVHFVVDVPRGEMLTREEPKPETKQTTAARTARKQPAKTKYKPRGAAYTNRLRKSWSKRPIADEPKDPRFAEHHEELLRAVARKAEAAAAPDEEADLASTLIACHSVRCELELCAPASVIDDITEQLPRFHVGKRPLWNELREVPSEQAATPARACHRYIVDFAVEGADPRNLRLER